jgi:microcystin-dependent protein
MLEWPKTMRTTLTIDDDVLAAAKALAELQHKTTGEVISTLARQALQPTGGTRRYRNGVPLLEVKPNATPVTLELVNQLRDEVP